MNVHLASCWTKHYQFPRLSLLISTLTLNSFVTLDVRAFIYAYVLYPTQSALFHLIVAQ